MQFKDIVGQRVLINKLTEVIDSGRISHAQMFLGRMGYGTMALAVAYVQYLMCEHRIHHGEGAELRADSCGECPSCKKIQGMMHPDVHFFFPTVNTSKIEKPSCAEYRSDFHKFLLENNFYVNLNDWYTYSGAENKQGEYRALDSVELIEEVARKSYEGREKVFILWMAENDARMLSTVKSRVQTIRVPRILDAHLPEEAEGDYMIARRLENEMQDTTETKRLFVDWMRLLFKLKMAELSQWVESIASIGRERQKLFLNFVMDYMRRSFSQTAANQPANLNTGDARFDTMFPSMVTPRNVEQIYESLSEALFSIERNANPKVTFMQLSFQLSKHIKNR